MQFELLPSSTTHGMSDEGQQPRTAPQTSEDENRPRKARFRCLLEGNHEHNLVDTRTKATISDTLLNLMKAKWQKPQDQNADEVGLFANSSVKAS